MEKHIISGNAPCGRPAVSVIVPVYNACATLERCIDSILSQSFTDFELILVDDGSTDSSGIICRSVAAEDSRMKVISKPNGGVSSARNAGLDSASGRYVAFCDSDDEVCTDWLKDMYEAASDTGLAVCGYEICSAESPAVKMSLEFRSDDKAEILQTLLKARLLQFVWNKLFARSVIEKSGLRFDETMRIFEDEYFVLGYLASSTDVVCVPVTGYRYYLPDGFYSKYDFSLEAYQKIVDSICLLLGTGKNGVRTGISHVRRTKLPMIVYWYKVALGRYAMNHTYMECRDKIITAKKIARAFRDGPFNHLALRILPPELIYSLLRRRQK